MWKGVKLMLLSAAHHDLPPLELYAGLTDDLDIFCSPLVSWDSSSGRWLVENGTVYRKGSKGHLVWDKICQRWVSQKKKMVEVSGGTEDCLDSSLISHDSSLGKWTIENRSVQGGFQWLQFCDKVLQGWVSQKDNMKEVFGGVTGGSSPIDLLLES